MRNRPRTLVAFAVLLISGTAVFLSIRPTLVGAYTQVPAPSPVWDCRKFFLGVQDEKSGSFETDIAKFLDGVASSGTPSSGRHANYYDVIACRQP